MFLIFPLEEISGHLYPPGTERQNPLDRKLRGPKRHYRHRNGKAKSRCPFGNRTQDVRSVGSEVMLVGTTSDSELCGLVN